ncbi:hypothetical protein F4861DRAFT_440782 [Xylaria intraflava]|nr:hypothetical protein F4861DRAFT_440782 [Xylaria intraflava]
MPVPTKPPPDAIVLLLAPWLRFSFVSEMLLILGVYILHQLGREVRSFYRVQERVPRYIVTTLTTVQSTQVSPTADVEHCPFPFNNFIYKVDLRHPAVPTMFPGRQPCTLHAKYAEIRQGVQIKIEQCGNQMP